MIFASPFTPGRTDGWRFFIGTLALFFMATASYGQVPDMKVNGGFLTDSLKIGEQTAYYLSARYPSDLNVLFPDSTFAFTTFEFERRNYFPTRTENGISVDSAVYYLTTFEVDRVQYLELPVFVVQPQDCTAVRSARDSVLITQLVAVVPDSLTADKLPLKMNTAYQRVFFQFNFWVVLISLGVLLVVALFVWIFFERQIRAYLKARRLTRNHSQFVRTYESMLSQLHATFSTIKAETALVTWKKYMEQLESLPYTKLTTKETMKLIPDPTLIGNLRAVDKAIYGHSTTVVDSLENLKNFADERFSKKLEEVKHG
jgi:hypothetical protein